MRRACTCRKPAICGPRRRPRISISKSRSPRCASSPRYGRPGCCLATTGRSPRSPRHWTGPPRKSGSGWKKHARPGRPAWIWITPSPWYGTGHWTGTRRSTLTPIRRSARDSSGSAAPPPTSAASCTGWTRRSRPKLTRSSRYRVTGPGACLGLLTRRRPPDPRRPAALLAPQPRSDLRGPLGPQIRLGLQTRCRPARRDGRLHRSRRRYRLRRPG
jgi:hypothetical protein